MITSGIHAKIHPCSRTADQDTLTFSEAESASSPLLGWEDSIGAERTRHEADNMRRTLTTAAMRA